MPRIVGVETDVHVIRPGQYLFVKGICDDFPHRMAGFPTLKDFLDIEVEITTL